MKQFFLSILFVFVSVCTVAQKSPQYFLAKAEAHYEKGNYKRALRSLHIAENRDYGSGFFCGNAVSDYDKRSKLLRAKIFIQQEKYELARNALNSISFDIPADGVDSIRIRTYQLEFGKDSLRSMFDFSLKTASIDCVQKLECFVLVPLSNGTKMKFKIPVRYNFRIGSDPSEETKLNLWLDEFRESGNLSLIRGKASAVKL